MTPFTNGPFCESLFYTKVLYETFFKRSLIRNGSQNSPASCKRLIGENVNPELNDLLPILFIIKPFVTLLNTALNTNVFCINRETKDRYFFVSLDSLMLPCFPAG